MNTTTRSLRPTQPIAGPWKVRAFNETRANVLDQHGQGVALNISREHAERIVRAIALLAVVEAGGDLERLAAEFER